MNTTENNKLIAEFMSVDLHEYVMNGGKTLEYHSSWDWLMPVVEKIESNGFDVRIRKDDCVIYYCSDKSDDVVLYLESKSGKMESAYLAVVEFIKWYNKNKEEQQ